MWVLCDSRGYQLWAFHEEKLGHVFPNYLDGDEILEDDGLMEEDRITFEGNHMIRVGRCKEGGHMNTPPLA